MEEDPKHAENVRVFVRIRPINKREMGSASRGSCVSWDENANAVVTNGNQGQKYTYDNVAGPDSTQASVFEEVGKPITETCLKGYNGTIFAYGQTGSGKTFTISGPQDDKPNPELRGLMPRVFDYMFHLIENDARENKNRTEYTVQASFIEIYNEKIFDLLDAEKHSLNLREDSKRGTYVEGVTEYTVKGPDDCHKLLHRGVANRKVGETAMNRESSRSHSVFKLNIHSTSIGANGVRVDRYSQFNMIDLAGSERQKLTGAMGERLKEASQINKSLSALGNVITGLVDVSRGKHRHIPYRDSKLTFLLKQSLGGNSMTYIVACVSPANSAFGETLSTLRFAKRAKCIRNKAVRNENTQFSMQKLIEQNERLKRELRLAKQKSGRSSPIGFDIGRIEGEDMLVPVEETNLAKESNELTALRRTYEVTLQQERECRAQLKSMEKKLFHVDQICRKRATSRMSVKLKCDLYARKIEELTGILQQRGGTDYSQLNHFEEKVKHVQNLIESTENRASICETLSEQDLMIHDLKCGLEFINEIIPSENELEDRDLDALGILKEKCGLYREKYGKLQEEYFSIKQGAGKLCDRVEVLQDEVENLQAELEAKKREVRQVEQKILEVSCEKESVETKLNQQLRKMAEDFESKLEQQDKSHSELQEELTQSFEEKLVLKRSELEEAQRALHNQSDEILIMKGELKKKEDEESRLEDTLAEKALELKQQIERRELENKEYKNQVDTYEKRIDKLNKEHTQELVRAVAQAKKDYQVKFQQVTAELAEIQECDEASKKQMTLLRSESIHLRERNDELSSRVHFLKKELQQEKIRAEHRFLQLREKLSAKEVLMSRQQSQTLNQMEAKHERRVKMILDKQTAHYDEMQMRLQSEQEKRSELNSRLVKLQIDHSSISGKYRTAQNNAQKFEDLVGSLKKSKEEQSLKLREALSSSEKKDMEMSSLQRKLDAAAETLKSKIAANEKIRGELQKIKVAGSASEQKIGILKDNLSEMNGKLKLALQKCQNTEFDLVNLKEDNECLTETNAFQSTKIEELENLLQDTAERERKQSIELGEKVSKIKELEQNLGDLEKTFSDKTLEIELLSKKNSELVTEAENIRVEAKQHSQNSEETQKLRAIKDSLEKQVLAQKEEIRSNRSSFELDMDSLKSKFNEIKVKLDESYNSRSQLIADMTKSRNDEAKSHEQMTVLKMKNEELKKTIREHLTSGDKAKKTISRLKHENAKLIGHQNPNQKIQHHMRIKEENVKLKKQVQKLEAQLRNVSKGGIVLRSKKHLGLSARTTAATDKENANVTINKSSKKPVISDKMRLSVENMLGKFDDIIGKRNESGLEEVKEEGFKYSSSKKDERSFIEAFEKISRALAGVDEDLRAKDELAIRLEEAEREISREKAQNSGLKHEMQLLREKLSS